MPEIGARKIDALELVLGCNPSFRQLGNAGFDLAQLLLGLGLD